MTEFAKRLLASCAVFLMVASLCAQTTTTTQTGPVIITPACPQPVAITPSGVTDRTPEATMDVNEHGFLHASSHYQGFLSPQNDDGYYEKFAPVVYYPPAPWQLSNMHSYVNVVNPSTTSSITVTYEFYDENGCRATAGGSGTSFSATIPPEGFYMVPASVLFNDLPQAPCNNTLCDGSAATSAPQGRGMVRVTSLDGPFVGGTLHHNYGFEDVSDSDPGRPGAASMQPLQAKQDAATTLYLGPIPASTIANSDFLNGILPVFWIVNPNNACNNVNVNIFSASGIPISNTTFELEPYGSTMDSSLYTLLEPIYTASAALDEDIIIIVTSNSNLPLIGEGSMIDLYSGIGGANQVKYGRQRMGSLMASNQLVRELVNPSQNIPRDGVNQVTLMSVMNANTIDIGPVTITYFDRNGTAISNFTLASFPAGAVQRIAPGLANYPTSTNFAGWTRIRSCKVGLVGWVMRATEGVDAELYYRKVYGEVLHGGNGLEPGNGYLTTLPNGSTARTKASILAFVDYRANFSVPGYTAYVNDRFSNIGAHGFRFYGPYGTNFTGTAPAPLFAGLQVGRTNFTYEDNNPNYVGGFFAPLVVTNRVDVNTGNVRAMNAIGGHIYDMNDTFIEFGWDFPEPPPGGTYKGPGDVVPSF